MHFLHLLLFLPSPDLCPVHQHALYHAAKHHHSSPEVTSPLSLSYSPNTSNYLVRLSHYPSHVCLVRGSLVEGVAQILELALSFYHAFFPLPLALLTLPLSFVEHHHFPLVCPHSLSAFSRQAPNFLRAQVNAK
jgi:hypothetical protein